MHIKSLQWNSYDNEFIDNGLIATVNIPSLITCDFLIVKCYNKEKYHVVIIPYNHDTMFDLNSTYYEYKRISPELNSIEDAKIFAENHYQYRMTGFINNLFNNLSTYIEGLNYKL